MQLAVGQAARPIERKSGIHGRLSGSMDGAQ
jgi:hypothetical protein